jgi:hypothetical protein
MDKSTLVKAGHLIVTALDDLKTPPRAAMWVNKSDIDAWKLWLVPHGSMKDTREFYRRIAEIVTKHRAQMGGIDASDAEMVAADHPLMKAMSRIIRMEGLGDAQFSNSVFNGYYLPDGVVLRMNL